MVVRIGFHEGELVSIGKAAKLLGISINTLRNWDARGYIQPFRLNERCHRRYELNELRRLRQFGSRAYHPAGRGGYGKGTGS